MKVLFDGLQAGNRSGTGVYTIELARRLAEQMADWASGDDGIAFAWPRGAPLPESVEEKLLSGWRPRPGVSPWEPRCSSSIGRTDHLTLTLTLKSFFLPGTLMRVVAEQFSLPRILKGLAGDLIHYPANVGNLVGMRNVVLTVHDLSFLHHPAWFRRERALYYRYAVARSARLAKRIIAVSHATAQDLIERLGVPAERIDVIHNGVDESFRPANAEAQADVRARLRLPERFFLYFGTVEPRKNLVRLIKAWSAIAAKCPQDLVLAGRDGWKVGPIRDAAAASPHAGRIRFLGHVERCDTAALYSAADAFVYPSLFEGFGMPLLEAMACGTPVVTSNVSSLPEVAGDAALLVDPTDVEAMANGLERLVQDDALRARLIEKGTARAARFTWDRSAELTRDTYRKATEAPLLRD